ncbi:MAG: S-adenosylmethionine synthase [Cryomorphaceae bacterium BACL11 MAG-121001-bin54]|jgi:S-adenosylmethionine synthetase|nr:MAG: S-adenosylmethionine synthase [Cryomorphaceae bacterium BACL11 MAG-121001-bin54]KRO64566.1 MAG: S-adenosylmethionine synthase [Cryomorphaceae bacterium BACL11 MAG-121015-bin20]
MSYYFTSESVSEGHPDKVADQISDALLDNFLAQDPNSKVACETLVTTGLTVLSGEVTTDAYIDVQKIAREVILKIGYNKSEYKFDGDSCGVISTIHEQSPDINQGVVEGKGLNKEQGAGDQGMMFGYATNETENLMPLALDISHKILIELADIRKKGVEMTYLRPDSKSQVTLEYHDNHTPKRISDIVVSTQHDDFADEKPMQEQIEKDVREILIPRIKEQLSDVNKALFGSEKYHVNPTGKFVIGGPHGDTGLTGRKIIVDTYGGKGAHGGGAFSGKDPSKVDRSAAYATRHIAKNLVAAGIAERILVQVSYAIGVAEPMGIFVDTYGTSKVNMTDGKIAETVKNMACFNLKPASIISRLKLKNPIYSETAAYGHMGRKSENKMVTFKIQGKDTSFNVETFTWEKLDCQKEVKAAFNL